MCSRDEQKVGSITTSEEGLTRALRVWLVPQMKSIDLQQTSGNPDALFEDTSGISS